MNCPVLAAGAKVYVSTFWGHSYKPPLARCFHVAQPGSGFQSGLLPLSLERALCAWQWQKLPGGQNTLAGISF